MEKLKVTIIWQPDKANAVEVLIDDKTAWRGSSGADISDFLAQLEELDYITLRSYDSLAECLEEANSR